jgi:hypothetical protein
LRETVKVVALKTVTSKVPLVSAVGVASEPATVTVCPVMKLWAAEVYTAGSVAVTETRLIDVKSASLTASMVAVVWEAAVLFLKAT